MSFSSKVKTELVKKEYESSCCERSLLYGMALFSKSFSFHELYFQSENEAIIQLFRHLLMKYCRVDGKINVSPKGKNFSIVINEPMACAKIMTTFHHTREEHSLRINHANFVCNSCVNAFLAGVFLSTGTVSSPEKDYHLEFTVAYMNLSKSLLTLLQEQELEPKLTSRKGYHVIYFKDSGAIEDFLYIMGASSSMFDMMNIKIVKEIRNSVNRRANCETANIEKTVNAATQQLEAIVKIKKKKGLDSLSEPLRAMAEMRLQYPDLSLSELAQQFDPPLSRSGANHRLGRLVKIAKEL